MTPSQRCCFVLWGDQCDEVAAVLFVTTLRAAGLRVWVVGMSGKRISGLHGLRLLADLALDEALPLAPQARCVAIPCTAQTLAHFLHDPRLRIFLQHAVQEAIPLFLAATALEDVDAIALLALPAAAIAYYPAGEALLPFTQALAVRLAMP